MEEFKLYALVPQGARSKTNYVLPMDMNYSIMHPATNVRTQERYFIIVSNSAEGLDKFKKDFPSATILDNSDVPGNRADWEIVSFKHLDDGVSNFEVLIEKGFNYMKSISDAVKESAGNNRNAFIEANRR